jgi:hypothetical protein
MNHLTPFTDSVLLLADTEALPGVVIPMRCAHVRFPLPQQSKQRFHRATHGMAPLQTQPSSIIGDFKSPLYPHLPTHLACVTFLM